MSMTGWQRDNKWIQEFYANLVRTHGLAPQSLDWGSQHSQEVRFKVLSEIGDLRGSQLLDVGCGLADFHAYLARQQIPAHYTGFDLNPEAINLARQRFPALRVEVRDLLQKPEPENSHDYVFASGIFYLRKVQPLSFMEAILRAMFACCRRGVAFNSLSTWASSQDSEEFYANPAEVLELCRKITPRVVLRHDYLPHDFSVYLYKEQA